MASACSWHDVSVGIGARSGGFNFLWMEDGELGSFFHFLWRITIILRWLGGLPQICGRVVWIFGQGGVLENLLDVKITLGNLNNSFDHGFAGID